MLPQKPISEMSEFELDQAHSHYTNIILDISKSRKEKEDARLQANEVSAQRSRKMMRRSPSA